MNKALNGKPVIVTGPLRAGKTLLLNTKGETSTRIGHIHIPPSIEGDKSGQKPYQTWIPFILIYDDLKALANLANGMDNQKHEHYKPNINCKVPYTQEPPP